MKSKWLSKPYLAGALIAGGLSIAFGSGSVNNVEAAGTTPAERVAPTPEPPAREAAEEAPSSIRKAQDSRARALDAREAEIEQARVDLALARSDVERELSKLEGLIEDQKAREKAIRELISGAMSARVERTVKVTEKMPPANAAAYLGGLEDELAIQILQGMSVRRAAQVMSAMSPAKAASLQQRYLKDEPFRTEPKPQPKNQP